MKLAAREDRLLATAHAL